MDNWVLFLARRYLKTSRKEKSLSHTFFSILGLSVGVMTLVTVLGVMNGFQLGFMEDILEVSSTHLRLVSPELWPEEILEKAALTPGVKALYPMVDSQTLVQSPFSSPQGAFIRGIPPGAFSQDPELTGHLEILEGELNLSTPDSLVMGSEMARRLGVTTADRVSLLALTGPGFSLLKPTSREFQVVGIFRTGYLELDAGWAFVPLESALEYFAGEEDLIYGVKLENPEADLAASSTLAKVIPPGTPIESWRDFNKSFFGALRMEKTAMMILIGLIFLIVGANIRQSLKRSLREREEDLGLLKAVGAPGAVLRRVFLLEGLIIGLISAALGVSAGLALSLNINQILEGLQNLGTLVSGLGQSAQDFQGQVFYMDTIPVRVLGHEVALVFLFAVLSSTLSAWSATRSLEKLRPAEVLKAE